MEKRDTYLQSELRGLWSDKINNGKSQTENLQMNLCHKNSHIKKQEKTSHLHPCYTIRMEQRLKAVSA